MKILEVLTESGSKYDPSTHLSDAYTAFSNQASMLRKMKAETMKKIGPLTQEEEPIFKGLNILGKLFNQSIDSYIERIEKLNLPSKNKDIEMFENLKNLANNLDNNL